MTGAELFAAFSAQQSVRLKMPVPSDALLAAELGISLATLKSLREKELTALQVATLIDRHGRAAERRLGEKAIVPIVEFLELAATETAKGKTYQLFSSKNGDGSLNRYLEALRIRMTNAHGIYIFHDSRGRAIYAGKAVQQSLWKEMNLAFNRDRGEVQNIKRAYHPTARGSYGATLAKIRKVPVALHDIASYVSAYEVPDGLIGKFEALIVRSFANDLLKVRMETI